MAGVIEARVRLWSHVTSYQPPHPQQWSSPAQLHCGGAAGQGHRSHGGIQVGPASVGLPQVEYSS